MSINQVGLNNLLSIVRPKSTLDELKERREGLWKKLNQGVNNNDGSINTKQVLLELGEADRQIQRATYEEESRKLELENLKREEAAAKKLRERERLLAKHERVLQNASMRKLLSASGKFSGYGKFSAGTSFINGAGTCGAKTGDLSQYDFMRKAEEINVDVKESVEFGIAAAEVARRRKRNELKEENDGHKNCIDKVHASCKKKKKKKSINITL